MNDEILNNLARSAQQGDKSAFEEVFNLTADRIYKFMAVRLQDDETARDLTSQVFLDAWTSLPRYKPEKSFKTWIFTIARYTLIDHYRAHRPQASLEHVTLLPDKTDLESDLAIKLETEDVVSHLSDLPEIYQTVLHLKYIEELEYREIAQILGKTENHLRVLVKRGLDKLKISLEQDHD